MFQIDKNSKLQGFTTQCGVYGQQYIAYFKMAKRLNDLIQRNMLADIQVNWMDLLTPQCTQTAS